MSYQVLARKWRPKTFDQMIGQEPILRMFTNALQTERLHHAYLLTGTRGVGKTTLGRILAKCLNCEKGITAIPCLTCKTCTAIDSGHFLDLLEIDAASRTKVEDTRELLDNIHYQPVVGRFKIYLIDEVHMLSGHSFNALLKTLEEPPPYVKFILATTDPKRLPITILSRCLQFHLKRVDIESITKHLQHICEMESISYETKALEILAKAADGSIRDSLSLLDQAIAYCGTKITVLDIQNMLGLAPEHALFNLLQALAEQNGQRILDTIRILSDQACDFNQTLEDLLSILHQVAIAQVIKMDSTHSNERIHFFASQFSAEEIQLFYQIALIGRRDLPWSGNPEQGFEMVLLRMLAFRPVSSDQGNKPKSSISQKTQENEITTHATINAETHADQWVNILPKLNLNGMAHTLAANCTLQTITQDKIILALSKQHEPMLNKKLIDRIEQAMNHYYKKPIHLEIHLTTNEMLTPSKQHVKEQTEQKSKAEEALKNDSEVQKIMDLFNATLDVHSIKSITE